jgi:hypothetical protein
MSVNSVTGGVSTADAYATYNSTSAANTSKQESTEAQEGVVYEKSTQTKSATYSVNKMSQEDRTALVEKLKADQESRQQSLVNIVQQMMGQQAKTASIANGDDSMWRFLASGNFTVDAATKAQAQSDIAEDGYYGVSQTSQRLFDFASALAGDDVDKMKEMQAAIEKGYKLATKSWGSDLPDISKNTLDATNKLFENYYASKTEE